MINLMLAGYARVTGSRPFSDDFTTLRASPPPFCDNEHKNFVLLSTTSAEASDACEHRLKKNSRSSRSASGLIAEVRGEVSGSLRLRNANFLTNSHDKKPHFYLDVGIT